MISTNVHVMMVVYQQLTSRTCSYSLVVIASTAVTLSRDFWMATLKQGIRAKLDLQAFSIWSGMRQWWSHSPFIHDVGSARMQNNLVDAHYDQDAHYDVLDDSKLHLMHQIGGKNMMIITRGESTKHRWEWWLWKSEYQPNVEGNYSLMW